MSLRSDQIGVALLARLPLSVMALLLGTFVTA
jgi:hypothetical protein